MKRRIQIISFPNAVAARILALNGRVIKETQARPLGCEAEARRDAEEWARQHGMVVA